MLCENILFLRILNFFNITMNVLRFIIPIILILKLILDIYKGIINIKDNNIKEKIIPRILACIIIFLVPTIINILLGLIENISGTSFNYSECNYNIQNISLLVEQQELEEKIKAEAESSENLIKYQQRLLEIDNIVKNNLAKSSSSGGIFLGQKYDLSESELRGICGVAIAEQGTLEGAKAEASLIANQYEFLEPSKKAYGKGIYYYVRYGGWFAHVEQNLKKSCPSEYLAAIRDVLVNGNRTLPLYIDEHDCFDCNKKRKCSANGNSGDICSISTNGSSYSSMDIIKSRSNQYYIQDKTHVHTVYKQSSDINYWVFYKFVQQEKNGQVVNVGDPFGYQVGTKQKFDSMNK